MTGKLGVSLCPEHATGTSRLLDHAEDALHQAAREGGNAVRIHAVDTPSSAHSESIIARQIVDAIPNGELKLRYQPLVSARDGHVVGMEALLRWQSPTLGMLVPERFMRTAERLGIIVQIGTWVLEGALKQAKLWRDQGFDDFTIAVNVSTLRLLRPNFFTEVMGLIQAAGGSLAIVRRVRGGENAQGRAVARAASRQAAPASPRRSPASRNRSAGHRPRR